MSDTQLNTFQIELDAINSAKTENDTIVNQDISFQPGTNSNKLIQRFKIQNLDTDLNNLMNRSGDVAIGQIQGISGSNNLDSITKQYVDDIFATLNQSVTLRQKYPDITQLNPTGNTISISGYKVLSSLGLITSSVTSTLDLISSNVEGNLPIVYGNPYYLYLTPSGPLFSTTAPNVVRVHPTNPWPFVTTVFTTSGPNTIKPFILKNGYYKYLNNQATLLTTTTSGTYTLNLTSLVSPSAGFVDLSVFGGGSSCSGVQAYFTASLTSATYQAIRNITGYCGAGGGNNQGCGLQSEVLVSLDNQQVRVILTISSATATIRLGGFYESWH